MRGRDVAVDPAGNSYVFATQLTSTTENCVLRKYSPLGNRLWSRQLAASCEAGGIDIARDGTLALAGGLGPGSARDFWVARYSAEGVKIWAKTVNLSQYDLANDVVAAPDGSIYVTGYYYLVASNANIWTAKYSPSGARLWARTYVTSGDDVGNGVAVAPDGGVYVAGVVGASPMLWLRRYGPTGGVEWTRTFNPATYAGAIGVAVAPDKSVYVVGYATSTSQDVLLVKYQPTGVRTWSRTHDGAAGSLDLGQGVAVAGNGTVYVAGYSTVNSLSGIDILAAAYAPTGLRKWYLTANGSANYDEEARGVAVAPDGSAIFAGYVFNGSRSALWLKRIQSME
jgi:uncharacterized delta-60 repeat protein